MINMVEKTSYEKGEDFEKFVLDMFPEKYFKIVFATARKSDLHGRGMEMCRYPDFQLRDKTTDKTFWIECKYRARMFRGKIFWCSDVQMDNYWDVQRETNTDVYVAIGVGGMPNSPEEVAFFQLKSLLERCIWSEKYKYYTTGKNRKFKSLNELKKLTKAAHLQDIFLDEDEEEINSFYVEIRIP